MRYNSLGKLVKDEDDLWNEVHALRDENRKLRYERLMWKAEAIRKESSLLFMVWGDRDSQRCSRIATAIEERAMKIKEEM